MPTIEKTLAMGLRKPPSHLLTDDEIRQLKDDIRSIGADESIFVFNSEYVRGTCYRPQDDKVHIKGNVLRDQSSTHPRDLLSQRAVLAHEYYGHRPYKSQYLSEFNKLDTDKDEFLLVLAKREWADEFRASYMAARNTPGLADEDRYYLILDALERAKEASISIKYNEFIRGILYGGY
ncbi:MAG: hypothetical protein FWF85_02260 [Clostridiales bacterium]|nr:hypothetical protein [Clostridiales bacterium]